LVHYNVLDCKSVAENILNSGLRCFLIRPHYSTLPYGRIKEKRLKKVSYTLYVIKLASNFKLLVRFEVFTAFTMKNVFCDIRTQFVLHGTLQSTACNAL
jgi:hypothetical protein